MRRHPRPHGDARSQRARDRLFAHASPSACSRAEVMSTRAHEGESVNLNIGVFKHGSPMLQGARRRFMGPRRTLMERQSRATKQRIGKVEHPNAMCTHTDTCVRSSYRLACPRNMSSCTSCGYVQRAVLTSRPVGSHEFGPSVAFARVGATCGPARACSARARAYMNVCVDVLARV